MEGGIKKNKRFYEDGRWRCASKKIQWVMHKTTSWNSKGHLNITHSREKVYMSNILLHDIFNEK
jgi:hypothetical protein